MVAIFYSVISYHRLDNCGVWLCGFVVTMALNQTCGGFKLTWMKTAGFGLDCHFKVSKVLIMVCGIIVWSLCI